MMTILCNLFTGSRWRGLRTYLSGFAIRLAMSASTLIQSTQGVAGHHATLMAPPDTCAPVVAIRAAADAIEAVHPGARARIPASVDPLR
jgi:hypothetical protein